MEMAVQSGKSMLKNKKGLTLIELLAVLVIVGIIAAIAIPAINATIDRSKTRADNASVQLIEDAAIRYATEENAVNGSTVTVDELVTKGYLNKKPTFNKTANAKDTATIAVDSTSGIVTITLSKVTTS